MKRKFGIILAVLFMLGAVAGHIVIKSISKEELYIHHVTMPIVAASDDAGMVGNVTFNLVPGTGRILFSSNPAIGTDMQYSMIIAAAYAQDYADKTLNNTDLVIDLDIPLDVLDGDSAGAAITIGMVALLENKEVNSSIILTGTVSPEGNIRRVGEIREKAIIAQKTGYKLMLVPPGQSRIRSENITLQEFMNNTIEIREVSTIQQAIDIMII